MNASHGTPDDALAIAVHPASAQPGHLQWAMIGYVVRETEAYYLMANTYQTIKGPVMCLDRKRGPGGPNFKIILNG